eukprot:COSAG02_NODE_97_length_37159_cov_37.660335_21_plen_50_part_00
MVIPTRSLEVDYKLRSDPSTWALKPRSLIQNFSTLASRLHFSVEKELTK